MKIGVIHPAFDSIGGAEQVTKSMLRGLVNAEHDVSLYTITKAGSFSHIKRRFARFSYLPLRSDLINIWRTYDLYKQANENDVIISNTLRVANTKKPTIIYCHSTFESELQFVAIKPKGKLRLYREYLQKHVKRQIDVLKTSSFKYIANSLYTKNKIKELFDIDSNIIYPPVTMKNISSDKNRDGIITVSRFGPEKNLTFNIDVIKDFVDTTYKIYGDNKQHYNNIYYGKILEQSKHYNNIKLFANQSRDVLEKNLCESKVYFQSSRENFGISVVEGIMAGCIPIVPNNYANKETVPFRELRFEENDINDAREKLKSALAGDYDKYLPELKHHVKQFTEEEFHKNMLSYVSKIS